MRNTTLCRSLLRSLFRFRLVWLAILMGIASATLAQPVDPKQRAREQAMFEAQGRVETQRRALLTAEDRVRRAEAGIQSAGDRRARAEAELRDAIAASDRSNADLDIARGQAETARQAYETESARFQSLRRAE